MRARPIARAMRPKLRRRARSSTMRATAPADIGGCRNPPDRHAAASAQDLPVGDGRHRAFVVDVGRVFRQLVPVDGRARRTAVDGLGVRHLVEEAVAAPPRDLELLLGLAADSRTTVVSGSTWW